MEQSGSSKVIDARPREPGAVAQYFFKHRSPTPGGVAMGSAGLVAKLTGLAVAAIRDRRNGSSDWSAQLAVATWPLSLGSETSVTYHLRPERPQDLPETETRFDLLCTEHVRFHNGNRMVQKSSRVFSRKYICLGSGQREGFESTVAIRVPVHSGGPSLSFGNRNVGHSRVEWTLVVSALDPLLPALTSVFDLTVVPRLHPDHARQRLQDDGS